MKPIAKSFHEYKSEEPGGRRWRELFTGRMTAGGGEQHYRGEGRVGKPGRASDLQGNGRRGTFLSNLGPSLHADRHLPKSQKGLTNARGNYDYPCVRDVRPINHWNCSSVHSQHPAPGPRVALPFPALLLEAGLYFYLPGKRKRECDLEAEPGQWAAQEGCQGPAGHMCHRGAVAEPAVKYPKLRDHLGVLRKEGIYVLANHPLTSLPFPPYHIQEHLLTREAEENGFEKC